MGARVTRVYRLRVFYPPGSGQPGWTPGVWEQLLAEIPDKRRRRAVRRRGFRWPRERVFLSADGAYHRASRLTWLGAVAEVEASEPVTWWEDRDVAGWWPGLDEAGRGVLAFADEVARFARGSAAGEGFPGDQGK
jgi:hypothetical protein